MEAALAEFKAEDIGIDQEDDIDFAIVKGSPFPQCTRVDVDLVDNR